MLRSCEAIRGTHLGKRVEKCLLVLKCITWMFSASPRGVRLPSPRPVFLGFLLRFPNQIFYFIFSLYVSIGKRHTPFYRTNGSVRA